VVLDGSYLLKKKSRIVANTPFGQRSREVHARRTTWACAGSTALTGTYSRGAWTGTLQHLYRSGYTTRCCPAWPTAA
jgi:iron complex outermembrane receptor protein